MKTRNKIAHVARNGKWLEFWFDGSDHTTDPFEFCCKPDDFLEALERRGIREHVFNHGVVGLFLELKQSGTNRVIERVTST